jgi:hypothetical protein
MLSTNRRLPMLCGKVVVCTLLLCALSTPAISQTRDRNPPEVYADVLNLLFPLNVESKPYYVKFILRFHDTDTQLVLIVYPGRTSELVSFSLDNMKGSDLFKLISEMLVKNPGVKDEEIAAKVKVHTTRTAVDYKAVEPALNDLKSIRISPFFQTRVFVDEYSEYDYWFDSGQESVHYKICSIDSAAADPQDQLAHWMTRFRANSASIVVHHSGTDRTDFLYHGE